MIKVLFLPSGTIETASSRYRVYQFLEPLRTMYGVYPIVIEPPTQSLPSRVNHLLRTALLAPRVDVVLVQKHHGKVFQIVQRLNDNMVFDFDDAVFTCPTYAPLTVKESIRRTRIGLEYALSKSRSVLAGNRYLAAFASQYNANVTVIPTVLDTRRFRPSESEVNSRTKVTVGWVGNPENLPYLFLVEKALSQISEKFGGQVEYQIISSQPFKFTMDVPVVNRQWHLDTEIEDLCAFDIGIMPLTDDEWTRGKCGFKLLQYMALAIPAVASPVGVNQDIIRHGENGFLAESTSDWIDVLTSLIDDASLRTRVGRQGRETVVRHYSMENVLPRLASILHSR